MIDLISYVHNDAPKSMSEFVRTPPKLTESWYHIPDPSFEFPDQGALFGCPTANAESVELQNGAK